MQQVRHKNVSWSLNGCLKTRFCVLSQMLHRGCDGEGALLFAGCRDVRQGVREGGVACERDPAFLED